MSYKYQVGETYKSRNRDEIDKLRQKYLGRGEFAYDPNTDGAYLDYAKMMREQGALAMEDTVGKASAATGGYGNSYAQTVGQQAYNDYAREISAAQDDFYDRALNRFNAEGNLILNDIGMLEERETADRAAWEEDYLNAYNTAVASGDKSRVAEILGMSVEEYNESLMASGEKLGEEQIQGYINALRNGDTHKGEYYDNLLQGGYNVGNIASEANAYALANNIGMNIDGEGNISFRYSDADINSGITGISRVREGEDFEVVMHKSEHGSADNLNVELGSQVDKEKNKGLYTYALATGKGLISYNNVLYYSEGENVYKVNAKNGYEDEYNKLLKLIQTQKGRKGE